MDLINLTQDIASLNAVYLTVSVGIILAVGVAFYFFNFKPLQEKITKQEDQLNSEKKSNEQKFERLTANVKETQKNALDQIEKLKEELTETIESKANNAEKRVGVLEDLANRKIGKMERKATLTELKNLWDKHYLWDIGDRRIHMNALRALIIFLEKSIECGMFVASPEMYLEAIDQTLDNIKEGRSLGNKDNKQKLCDRLVNALSKLDGHDKQRKELIKKAGDILLADN